MCRKRIRKGQGAANATPYLRPAQMVFLIRIRAIARTVASSIVLILAGLIVATGILLLALLRPTLILPATGVILLVLVVVHCDFSHFLSRGETQVIRAENSSVP